ncbi:hypothetical protein [Streptomyces sp. RTd22]|uniref:hypothetical protein n=1 Tax=Streptomyces sp. RTd22 TaxID=1841249 RepID=UPI0018FE3122|nr:hypothetical protein [Streptomyces sp. RTd22]
MANGRRGIEAGDIAVMAGLSSDDISCSVTVTIPALAEVLGVSPVRLIEPATAQRNSGT